MRNTFFGVALAIAVFAGGRPEVRADDLEQALQSVVRVRTTVPLQASTAATLGTRREGNGVLIDGSGLILTIGYLIVEADRIEVESAGGVLRADFVGYDADSGFGLVRARGFLGTKPMPLGDSSLVQVGDELVVGGFGGENQPVRLISRGEFVGSWEYLLEDALYAAPAYRDFGGAALIREGRLVGVGSILATFSVGGSRRLPCNMFVPIDLLKPILAELVRAGRSSQPPHPWLGVNTDEIEGHVMVTLVTPGGPADKAGLQKGDIILAVDRQPVAGVAQFYRRVWAAGPAGAAVRLRVLQGERIRELTVRSADRSERLLHPARPNDGVTFSQRALAAS